MKTNQDVYTTVEFDCWAQRGDLLADERFVIERHLDPKLRTIEAGTGGGRLVRAMQERGFTSLSGFDFVPQLIEAARKQDSAGKIDFQVQDATRLAYPDAAFDQIVYLQQILSLIDGEEKRSAALREAWRILKPGGTALFSFLSFEARGRSATRSALITYLRVLRLLTGADRPPQMLPWLVLGGKFNYAALLDRGPYVYWFKTLELGPFLTGAGFQILAATTSKHAAQGISFDSLERLAKEGVNGSVYVVCKK